MAKRKENNPEQVNLNANIPGTEGTENIKPAGTTRKKKNPTIIETLGAAVEDAVTGISNIITEGTAPKKSTPTRKPKEAEANPTLTSMPEQLLGTGDTITATDSDQVSLFTDMDIYLFREGRHYKIQDKLGSHVIEHRGVKGTYFALWAPNAAYVSVIGTFNGWNRESHPMQVRPDSSGIWECFVPHIGQGMAYKYYIQSNYNYYAVEKADPYAIHAENPPRTASIVWERGYDWQDQDWMTNRKAIAGLDKPYAVYELHLGSWRRVPEDGNRSLSYREMAEQLPDYLKFMGYTHVEFMPVMEHPFFGSWGYQITGFFAPTSRYGTPQEFKYLIDKLHQEGIGVILDWVPSHFPEDLHGLGFFDGTHLYEHEDKRKGFHPDWKSLIFNFGRNEVKSFLISNALYWLKEFHIDGLRVDAVASMLYLDYSRNPGEWIPNEFGGRENLESIRFLEEFNSAVQQFHPDVVTVAEESTDWPKVSQPVQQGGLGFTMKWMMGWMHDTLSYLAKEPIYRTHHQGQIAFSIHYAFTENFMMPLSHDEVVHGKGSLVNKMPGDEWQKFANLRLLYGYMYAHPGAKLVFMGGEFGQFKEWNHDASLEWQLIQDYTYHKGLLHTVRQLNHLYREESALHEQQFSNTGFEWIDANDATNSVLAFLRKGNDEKDVILVVCNFTPVVRENYRVGVPFKGEWTEIFNSDMQDFGGSGVGIFGWVKTFPVPYQGKRYSITLNLPPLGVTYYKYTGNSSKTIKGLLTS